MGVTTLLNELKTFSTSMSALPSQLTAAEQRLAASLPTSQFKGIVNDATKLTNGVLPSGIHPFPGLTDAIKNVSSLNLASSLAGGLGKLAKTAYQTAPTDLSKLQDQIYNETDPVKKSALMKLYSRAAALNDSLSHLKSAVPLADQQKLTQDTLDTSLSKLTTNIANAKATVQNLMNAPNIASDVKAKLQAKLISIDLHGKNLTDAFTNAGQTALNNIGKLTVSSQVSSVSSAVNQINRTRERYQNLISQIK